MYYLHEHESAVITLAPTSLYFRGRGCVQSCIYGIAELRYVI